VGTDGTKILAVRPDELVAAVFFDDVSARDAMADLKLAGFAAESIGVAISEQGKRADLPTDVDGKHSLLWRLRHSFQHDLHSKGPGFSTQADPAAASAENLPFTELDLPESLLKAGVAPDTIQLLNDRMGTDGLLIVVDAGERLNEVESILVQNRGMLRTAMVTQQTHAAG
jgi:hypothetical protein